MRRLTAYLLLTGYLACLSGCDRQSEPTIKRRIVRSDETASQDPDMARKLADAKAAYAKLAPAEKAKLAAEMEKVKDTLPMSLTEMRSIKIHPADGQETTLGLTAPIGTPTIIAAWASWCVPCRIEARELARLRQQYGRDKLNIVYLNIGNAEVERSKGPAFLREAGAQQLGLTMLDEADFLKLTRVGQLSVPRVLIFDRTGKPTMVIAGTVADGRDIRLVNAIKKAVA